MLIPVRLSIIAGSRIVASIVKNTAVDIKISMCPFRAAPILFCLRAGGSPYRTSIKILMELVVVSLYIRLGID